MPKRRLLRDVHRNRERLDQRPLLHAHPQRELIAKVLGQDVVLGQCAVEGRGGRERHVGAEVVFSFFAVDAAAAGDAGFHGDRVAGLEGRDRGAGLDDRAGGFVAEDHGGGEGVGADGAVAPVVHLDGEACQGRTAS